MRRSPPRVIRERLRPTNGSEALRFLRTLRPTGLSAPEVWYCATHLASSSIVSIMAGSSIHGAPRATKVLRDLGRADATSLLPGRPAAGGGSLKLAHRIRARAAFQMARTRTATART